MDSIARAPAPPRRRPSPSPTCSIASTTRPRSSSAASSSRCRRERGEVTEPAEGRAGRLLESGLSSSRRHQNCAQEADVVVDAGRACRRSRGASGRSGRCRTRRRTRTTPPESMPTAANTAGSTMPQPPELDPAGLRARPAALAVADGAGHLELGRRLGEGEVGRAEPRVDVRHRSRPSVNTSMVPARSPKVIVAVDHQALDLVEDRQMAGVGGVAAVARPASPTWMGSVPLRTASSMRWICTGDVWVRSSDRLRLAEVEIDGVAHAAGRVGRRDVQRFEVVPVGLGLGTLGHVEAHADEDVLELVPGLASPGGGGPAGGGDSTCDRDDLGQVETVRPQRLGPFGLGQLGPPGDEQGLDAW